MQAVLTDVWAAPLQITASSVNRAYFVVNTSRSEKRLKRWPGELQIASEFNSF